MGDDVEGEEMKAIGVGSVIGIMALLLMYSLKIEINLANYLIGYVAGMVAMFFANGLGFLEHDSRKMEE